MLFGELFKPVHASTKTAQTKHWPINNKYKAQINIKTVSFSGDDHIQSGPDRFPSAPEAAKTTLIGGQRKS